MADPTPKSVAEVRAAVLAVMGAERGLVHSLNTIKRVITDRAGDYDADRTGAQIADEIMAWIYTPDARFRYVLHSLEREGIFLARTYGEENGRRVALYEKGQPQPEPGA